MSRDELIYELKQLGYNYKFDKYTDQQLYNIYQWAINKEKKNFNKEIKYDNDLDNPEDWFSRYKGYDIYYNNQTEDFKIEHLNVKFPTEEEVFDYIDSLVDDEV